MPRVVRIGIVGAKFAGSFHADCWATVRDTVIVAVADLDQKARDEYQAKYRVPKSYGDYRELIRDPDIDVVDICVPNFLHAEVAIAAMEAGKDVICEKPLATILEDGRKVTTTRKKTGRRFFYAEDWIFAPALVRAKALIDEGAIGKALYFRGKECHSGSHSPFAQKIKYCGGGSLIHLGIHPAGFFHHLLGLPKSVIGHCSGGGDRNLQHKEFEGEDFAVALLTYADGTQVNIEGNYVTWGGMEDFVEIYGTTGAMKVEMTFGSPLHVYSQKGFGYAIEKADFTHGWTRPAVDEQRNLGYPDELAHFTACIRGDAQQMRGTTAEAGCNVLRIIDAAYRSHKEGRTVEL